MDRGIPYIRRRVVAQTNGTAIFQKYLFVQCQYGLVQLNQTGVPIAMLDALEVIEVHSEVTLKYY